MTTTLDLLYVALFAIGFPLWDYFVSLPAFHRRLQVDPARARMRLFRQSIATAWPLIAVGAALWVANDRSWASFGFSLPDGWRLWMSITMVLLLAAYLVYGVVTVARNSDARAGVRKQFSGELANVLPHTRRELYWFGGVALTAGFCEEFLYRGYFVCVFAPWLGWWGAAALSVPFFAIGHLYQGWNGVLRTGIVGALFTLLVALFDSLWPAIALHAILDLGQGTIAWLALREDSARDNTVEGSPSSEPLNALNEKSR